MAAKTKTELLDISQKEYGKLMKLIEFVDANTGLRIDGEDISIKDVVAHRAHWIELFLGWHADGLAGKTVYFPAEGCRWNDLKRYNSDLRKRQSDMDWVQASTALRESHGKLRTFIDSSSHEELYSGPMKGANNQWTPGRWAEAAGRSHFRSDSKYIRARLKEAN